jgi:HEAT repeat protein
MARLALIGYGSMALFRIGKPDVKALARQGDKDALMAAAGFQDLIRGVGDEMVDRGAEVRREAILALGQLGPDSGREAVQAALSDPADPVRVAAIQVLFAREEATPLATALAWLPRDEGDSRRLAMTAIAELRQPDCVAALMTALMHAQGDGPIEQDEGALLAQLLESAEDPDAACELVEQLLTALADERDAVSARAEDLLARVAPASIEDVIAELEAGAVPHRAAAVLARIKDTRALEPLMEALLHRDARVRAESAAALGELRDPAAVEALIHATRDSDHGVRASAGSALDQLGMVALVIGVSMMVRPMIREAMGSAAIRPGPPEVENVPSRNGNGNAETHYDEPLWDPSSAEVLEGLLASLEESGELTDEPG